MKKKNSSNEPLNKAYGYYNELLQLAQKSRPFPIYRINNSGSRMSSKTWSAIRFLVVLCLIAKTKVDGFRYMKGKDRQNLFNQFIKIIETYPCLIDLCKIHKTDMTITFPNGSIIEVSGLHSQSGDKISSLGVASSAEFTYHIALAEERYEISDEEWSFVIQALRGAINFMEIHLSNPWIFTNDYVKYCHGNLAYDLEILKSKGGQQFSVVVRETKLLDGTVMKTREIFHYTNYSVNDYLTQMDKYKLEIAAEHDPHRANTILYGFPGSPKGSIWKWTLPKIKQKPRDPSVTFVGGVDYGERDDPTTAYIAGFNVDNSHGHIEHEYYFSNARSQFGHKDTSDLAEDVVNHYIDFYEQRIKHGQLQVMVDGSAIPFITALNTYCQAIGWDDEISFIQQTDKKTVADRIEKLKTLASFGIWTVDEKCTELLRELNEQVYADKSRNSVDYIDGDDHATDAIYYALVTKWIELLEQQEIMIEQEAQEREANNG